MAATQSRTIESASTMPKIFGLNSQLELLSCNILLVGLPSDKFTNLKLRHKMILDIVNDCKNTFLRSMARKSYKISQESPLEEFLHHYRIATEPSAISPSFWKKVPRWNVAH